MRPLAVGNFGAATAPLVAAQQDEFRELTLWELILSYRRM
jgi:hypothetical protein